MAKRLKPWEEPPPTPEDIRRNTELFEAEIQKIGEWKNRKLAEEAAKKKAA